MHGRIRSFFCGNYKTKFWLSNLLSTSSRRLQNGIAPVKHMDVNNSGNSSTKMAVESLGRILERVEDLTKAPENYLSIQEEAALKIRDLTKQLYDLNKKKESPVNVGKQTLEELILGDLDEEQIWQQIDLQNNYVCQELVSDFAQFLVKKKNFSNVRDEEKKEQVGEFTEDLSDNHQEESITGDDKVDDPMSSDTEYEEERVDKKKHVPSVVDDKFFKLCEMEEFLKREEGKKEDSDDDEDIIDYFENIESDFNDEKNKFRYDDFFDQPEDAPKQKRRQKISKDDMKSKKKVKFSEMEKDFDSQSGSEEEHDSDSQEEEASMDKGAVSTFEARQERVNARIKALEEEALQEKPWQLKGEVTAKSRPYNSLLEEYVEFDTAARPPPVITEKTTMKLEDIIIQRIKDKVWDDVERKIKPVNDPKEYKKKLVLDQEKSKLSLAQIYEQEYLKQKEAQSGNAEDKPEEVPKEHVEIENMMTSLFSKLDALSNFHYTPKMVSAEVKIVSNLPAITMEEVAPLATSDGALLAPEEVKPKLKGDLIGKSERSKTDKRRERRLKKKKQKLRLKVTQKKEETSAGKEKLKDFTKKEGVKKKKSKKLLSKLGRISNITQLNESSDGKYIKSSNAFFTKLQDEVKSQIQQKSTDKSTIPSKKIDIKKLKL